MLLGHRLDGVFAASDEDRLDLDAGAVGELEALVAQREANDAVLSIARERTTSLAGTNAALLGELAERRRELSGLRGDLIAAKAENASLKTRVDELTALVADLEARLAEVPEDTAEVLSLPRRPMQGQRALSDELEIWGTEELPRVVDLIREAGAVPVQETRLQA